jgi:hypothetical protein
VRLTTVTLDRRPALRRRFRQLHAAAWPAFLNDVPVNALWPRLYSEFPEYQLALVDARGRAVAVGNTVPLAWDGRPGSLPDRGRYVVPGAFQPIAVDRARDHVLYEEANVWMLHPLGGARRRASQERAATSPRRSARRPASRSRE